MKIENNKTEETMYSLVSQDVTFVQTRTGQFSLCRYLLIRIEQPKLFLFETKQGRTFLKENNIKIHSMNIFTYVNSRFIYVETYKDRNEQTLKKRRTTKIHLGERSV